MLFRVFMLVCLLLTGSQSLPAADGTGKQQENGRTVKRVLLLGQSPDGHPWATHEYMAGMRILAHGLQPVDGLQTIVEKADEPWTNGPELIDSADGAVVFLSEGAKWLHQDAARLKAFQRLAQRGGGLVTWHWGMGCRSADDIPEFVKLFGGCHGGPDRKYKVVEGQTEFPHPDHPVLRGIRPFHVKEEFYYRLKFAQPSDQIVPLIQAPIEGKLHTVAWAWERPDGGRSFGYSGGHFHRNWQKPEYRRLITQAVLWTLDVSVPNDGLTLDVPTSLLKEPRPRPKQER